MLEKLIQAIDNVWKIDEASAHCDIPCKIYDPSSAQIAVLSAIRFIDLIEELNQKDRLSLNEQAQLMRLVREKEIHAAKVKEEVRVIWGDYFKQPQFDQFPNTHELVHNIMMQSSKVKQHCQREHAEVLLKMVNDFADSFWQTKGVATFEATCPYPPAETVVYPKLN